MGTLRKCERCDGPILRSGAKGRPPKFCSVKCNQDAQNAKDSASRQASRRGRICPRCGSGFDAPHSARQRFCSASCRTGWFNERVAARKHGASVRARRGRTCAHCGGSIPENRRIGSIYCRSECHRLALAADPSHRARQRDANLRRLYGIGVADVDRMIADQGGGCAICGTNDWGGKDGRPHVDHDHRTGRIRGILCGACNNGIGMFVEDVARLRAAVRYLDIAAGFTLP